MLLFFALDPRNADAEVMWEFGNIVNAGWVARDAFVADATRTQAILVATEGASDARILRRALDVRRPDVSDYIRLLSVRLCRANDQVPQDSPFPVRLPEGQLRS